MTEGGEEMIELSYEAMEGGESKNEKRLLKGNGDKKKRRKRARQETNKKERTRTVKVKAEEREEK